jgi:Methyltransferase domain
MHLIHKLRGLISPHFRARRLAWFTEIIAPPRESTILDVGGYPQFWEDPSKYGEITILNIHEITDIPNGLPRNLKLVVGDGCALDYPNKSFDIVFSNSVIEHLGTYANQEAFAAEARRVGGKLWIQTPAREFFFEPHLLMPFVHFLPRALQARLLRYGTVWGLMTKPSYAEVIGFLDEVRLLSHSEMKALFPDCDIICEKFMGMNKSYIAVRSNFSVPKTR